MKQRVRCRVCGVTAVVDKEERRIHIFQELPKPDFSRPRPLIVVSFPSHADCELAKPVDVIDLASLSLEVFDAPHPWEEQVLGKEKEKTKEERVKELEEQEKVAKARLERVQDALTKESEEGKEAKDK